jgi:hypothetical protein
MLKKLIILKDNFEIFCVEIVISEVCKRYSSTFEHL